jgi:DNA repair protein RadA/Sms
VANGIDRNRLSMILAVLARHGGPSLGSADVFVNVAGGVRIEEPGADLAVAMAIASAARDEPLSGSGAPSGCFGEVGLTGELRYVAHADRRLEEAARFGLEQIVLPARCADDELSGAARDLAVPAPTLAKALDAALGNRAQRSRAA